MFERSLEENEVSYRTMEFSSGKSLRRSLMRGVGVALCPSISVADDLQKGTLVKLNTRDIICETPVVMVWHIDKWCSALLKFFMGLTKEAMSSHQGVSDNEIH